MSSSRPVITLTTDFGLQDPYVGLMKGVILGINPDAEIIDVTHGVTPQNVLQGSFLLRHSHSYFPKDAIHVAVVDPGVGTNRRPVLLETPNARFIAPDNGLLTHVLLHGLNQPSTKGGLVNLPDGWKAHHLTNPAYWLQPLSHTFHGRDLFAPVAAHLSNGVTPSELGDEVGTLHCLPMSTPHWQDNTLRGRVVHVDRFGNLVTDIPATLLHPPSYPASPQPHPTSPQPSPSPPPPSSSFPRRRESIPPSNIQIEIAHTTIHGLSESYAEADGLLAIIGSFDTLEIALKNGNAAAHLCMKPGETIVIRTTPFVIPA